jgi:hypothetical protein
MIERLLEPGSTERPLCNCSKEMILVRTEVKSADTQLRIFECPSCKREMRLMVWSDETDTIAPG